MIERAARALFTPYTAKDGIYSFFFKSYDAVLLAKDDDDGAALHLRHLDRAARAALSAALDPEDESLVEAIARATSLCGRDWDAPFDFDAAPDYAQDVKRDEARAAISALKARLTPPQ